MYRKIGGTEIHKIIPYDVWKCKVAFPCLLFLLKKIWWQYATLFAFIFIQRTIDTSVHNSFLTIRWGPSPYLHSCRLSGGTSMGCQAERSELGPALQQASALLTEPRCTRLFTIWKLINLKPFSCFWQWSSAPLEFCKSPSHHRISSNLEVAKAPFSIGSEFKLFLW